MYYIATLLNVTLRASILSNGGVVQDSSFLYIHKAKVVGLCNNKENKALLKDTHYTTFS